jgi:hypothetical protein
MPKESTSKFFEPTLQFRVVRVSRSGYIGGDSPWKVQQMWWAAEGHIRGHV